MLDMPKYDRAWHEQDIADELKELEEAGGIIATWSELSDIVYTYTRACWSGHKTLQQPLSRSEFFLGALYMFPKYTLRWLFFRRIGSVMGATNITEVRNPKKTEKVGDIARRYGLDEEKFRKESERKLKYWPLLP